VTFVTQYWAIAPSQDSLSHFLALTTARPPLLLVLNDSAPVPEEAGETDEFTRNFSTAHFENVLPALKIADPAFAANWFQLGDIYISELLRAAMDLSGAEARYWPVDTSQSPPEIQALGYQRLQVLQSASLLDTDKSTGFWQEAPGGVKTWMPGDKDEMLGLKPRDFKRMPVVTYLEDFEPPASIFYCPLLHQVMVTDALAARVIDAGIEDLIFINNENDGTEMALKLRT
jgi:hypothetical protein